MTAPTWPWTVRRLALAGVAWAALSAIEYLVFASSSWSGPQLAQLVPFFAALALLWSGLTPAIAFGMRVADRASTHAGVGIAAAVVGIAIAGTLDALARRTVLVAHGNPPSVPFWATWLYFLDVTTAQYCAVVLATRVLQAHDALVARTRMELTLRAQLARTRLSYLEAQLQPHFLFNALGAVCELAYEAPQSAARMLRQLATLLRSALERRGEEVSLHEELATLAPYLEIQRVRFDDWLRIDQYVSAEAAIMLVPRLILQPLVENAIKHGLLGRSAKGHIKIVAHVEDGRLRISVRDNGVGLRAVGKAHTPGYGIGLRNVRERLATLYGDDWQLALEALPSGGTTVDLTIPARRPSAEPDDESDAAGVPAVGRVLEFIRRHPAAATAIGWFLWGSAWAGQSRAYLALRGRMDEAALPRLLVSHFTGTLLWALATPLVVWLARRLPLESGGLPRHLAVWRLGARVTAHLALATVLAVLLADAWHVLLDALLGRDAPPWPDAYVTSIFISVLAYLIVLGVGQYDRAMDWLHEREITAGALRAELEESRLRAATARAQPDALVHTLEHLANQVTHDVRGTERALADLADGLRQTLDGGRALQAAGD